MISVGRTLGSTSSKDPSPNGHFSPIVSTYVSLSEADISNTTLVSLSEADISKEVVLSSLGETRLLEQREESSQNLLLSAAG